jgi:hypothetical protein
MPMLCPSIPIDKNKQGGRNYDSSKMTDFKKICLISNDDTTKPDQQTNRSELRRGNLLASTLRSIPRFLPTIPAGNFLGNPCSSGVRFSGLTTFWIIYGSGSGGTVYTYNSNKLTPAPTNDQFVANGGYAKAILNLSTNLAANPNNRAGILKSINDLFDANTGTGKTIIFRLSASFTNDGRLIISTPSNVDPGNLLGLYFGVSPNGSADLGVFLEDGGNAGVDYAALLITGGTNTVTANFPITC